MDARGYKKRGPLRGRAIRIPRARYYDPKAGRFLTRDPIGFRGGDVNLYGYTLNNPVNNTDSEGLQVAIPASTPFPISLPPVFIPGTPANDAFVKSVNDIINAIKDAINPPNECNDREKDCDNIYYNVDVPTCRGIAKKRGKAAAERCYQSAADRYAACLRGQPMPPLDTWNN